MCKTAVYISKCDTIKALQIFFRKLHHLVLSSKAQNDLFTLSGDLLFCKRVLQSLYQFLTFWPFFGKNSRLQKKEAISRVTTRFVYKWHIVCLFLLLLRQGASPNSLPKIRTQGLSIFSREIEEINFFAISMQKSNFVVTHF